MLTWRHDAAFHLLPRRLPIGDSASGLVMDGASEADLATDSYKTSQQSRNGLAKSLYQGIRRFDPPGDFWRRPQLERCLRGSCTIDLRDH